MESQQRPSHANHSLRTGFLIFMTAVFIVLAAFGLFVLWLRSDVDDLGAMYVSYYHGKIYSNEEPVFSKAEADSGKIEPIRGIGIGLARKSAVDWKNEDSTPITFIADFVDEQKTINPGEILRTEFDSTTMKNGEYKYTIGSYSDVVTIMPPVGIR